jgi:hypothetical protein
MNSYTVTFKYDGSFDLPDDPDARRTKLPGMVLEKLESNDFEMVDFNLTENYDDQYAGNYIADPDVNRSVLEIRLFLTKTDLKSRDAIYTRCLNAMRQGELSLGSAYENEKPGLWQSIIVFDTNKQSQSA